MFVLLVGVTMSKSEVIITRKQADTSGISAETVQLGQQLREQLVSRGILSDISCKTCFYGPVKQNMHRICDTCFTLKGTQYENWVDKNIYAETTKEEEQNMDAISKPIHYNYSTVQPIDAIEAWKLNFRLSNVIKYVARHRQKNGLEDLKKALWYLQREIDKYDPNVQ
jgi:hypothetical protein